MLGDTWRTLPAEPVFSLLFCLLNGTGRMIPLAVSRSLRVIAVNRPRVA